LADNYLEMAKLRLYNAADPSRDGARYTLWHVLLTAIKLFAPFLPFVTDEIYQGLFAGQQDAPSLHATRWPTVTPLWEDAGIDTVGDILVELATAVRRYKSEHGLSLSTELQDLQLAVHEPRMQTPIAEATRDLMSITRARSVTINRDLDPECELVYRSSTLSAAVTP
jgi:valyl-tRNA synthetase